MIRSKRYWSLRAPRSRATLGVVGREPRVGDLAHLLERVEEVRVEDLFAEVSIEPLDEGVLIGLPGISSSGPPSTLQKGIDDGRVLLFLRLGSHPPLQASSAG